MSGPNQLISGWDLRLGNIRFSLIRRHLQVFFILLFSGLYVVRDLAGVYFPDIIFSGICGIAFLILDYGAALSVYIFTTALTVPQNEIMILYVLVFLVKQMSVGGIRFHRGMFMMTVALLVLQMVDMSLFSTAGWVTMLYDYITKMLYIVVPFLWYMVDTSPEDCKNALISYMWGCLLGALVVVVLTANQIGWSALFTGNQFQRLGVTVNESSAGMQSTYNANQLGGMMAISVSIALVLLEKKKIPVPLGLMICGFAIVVVTLTKSRTGLLCLIGAIALYLFYTFTAKKMLKGFLFVIACALLVGLMMYIEPELFSGIISRFDTQEDMTNGRSDLLMVYLRAWCGTPWSLFFGYGIKSFQSVITTYNVPHNAITDILICWGLAGGVMLTGSLVMFCKQSTQQLRKDEMRLAFIPVIVAVVMSMAGQYLTTGFPHLRLCFLIVAMKAFENDGTDKYRFQ